MKKVNKRLSYTIIAIIIYIILACFVTDFNFKETDTRLFTVFCGLGVTILVYSFPGWG